MVVDGQMVRGILHQSRGSERLFQKELSKEWSRKRDRRSKKMANFKALDCCL